MKCEECVLAHYGEIGIKGKNFQQFERSLIRNIKESIKALEGAEVTVKARQKRILIFGDCDKALRALRFVFGLESFARAFLVSGGKEQWLRFIVEFCPKEFWSRFNVKVKRVDKSLPFTSLDFAKEIGKALVKQYGGKVDLKEKEYVVFAELLSEDQAIIYFGREEGLGGLPVGSACKGVCLISGGIDSPLAAWRMMGRGLEQVFLHIRPMKEMNEQNKVYRLVKHLARWQNGRAKLYSTTCHHFSKHRDIIDKRYAAVLFRIFAHKLGERIAEKEHALMLVNGDALSQVASQTAHNIFLVDRFLNLPIARPLLSFSKREIISQAKTIGTYEISIEPYKDCCAMLVSSPTTKGKVERVKALVDQLNMDEIVDLTFEELECWDIYV